MVLYGTDLHPSYQRGISIPKISAEGFSFLAAKLSDGTRTEEFNGSHAFLDSARDHNMIVWGYHYLRAGIDPDMQAKAFVRQLRRAGVNGAVDMEAGSGDMKNLRTFLRGVERRNAKVVLTYLPRWFWQDHLGSPSLEGLPPLWSSRYASRVVDGKKTEMTGYASVIYRDGVPDEFWAPYGGNRVEILQFTSKAQVAGKVVDADAYRGTKAQLRALVS
jgi:lysozyme